MVASVRKMPLFVALRVTALAAFIGLAFAACADDDDNPLVSPGFGVSEAGGPARAPAVIVEAAAVDSTTVDTGPTVVVDLGLSDTAPACDGTSDCPLIFGQCPYTFGELTIGGVCEEIIDCAYCNNGQAAGWKISCTSDHVWVAVEYCD